MYYVITVFSVVDLQFLVEAGLYESPDESARREEVLGKLDQVATFVATHISTVLTRSTGIILL